MDKYKTTGTIVGIVFFSLAVIFFIVATRNQKGAKSDAEIKSEVQSTMQQTNRPTEDIDVGSTKPGETVSNIVAVNTDEYKHVSTIETKGILKEKKVYKWGDRVFYSYKIEVTDAIKDIDYFLSSDSFDKYEVGQGFSLKLYKTRDEIGGIYYSVKSLKV